MCLCVAFLLVLNQFNFNLTFNKIIYKLSHLFAWMCWWWLTIQKKKTRENLCTVSNSIICSHQHWFVFVVIYKIHKQIAVDYTQCQDLCQASYIWNRPSCDCSLLKWGNNWVKFELSVSSFKISAKKKKSSIYHVFELVSTAVEVLSTYHLVASYVYGLTKTQLNMFPLILL